MIIGVGSWRGIGATTTAVAIAASWAARGRRPWLVEADPAGGVLAARFAPGALVAGTLERIAFPEARSSAVERFEQAAIDHAGMRIVTAAGDPFRAWACHSPRVPWAAAVRELDGPVVVDLGRLRGATPVHAVLAQLDSLLLVADADVVSVVSTMSWAEALGRSAPADAPLLVDRTRIAMVDAPTAHDRIGRTDAVVELGDRFAGRLPWEPDTVHALFAGIGLDDRRLRRSGLVPSVHHLADRLADWAGEEVAA